MTFSAVGRGYRWSRRTTRGQRLLAILRWRSGEGREGLESTRQWLRAEYAMDRYVDRMERIYADVVGAGAPTPTGSG